jgi:SAM-dependent methyltransferase
MVFNQAYYENDLPKADHLHFQARADWIIANHGGKRVLDIGCGFGAVVAKLRAASIVAWGMDGSQYAVDNTYAPGFVFHTSAQNSGNEIKNQDFVVSWNFLDCLASEAEATAVVAKLDNASTNYHVICMDNGDNQSQRYKDQGYFIKSLTYWQALMPGMVIIDYHTQNVYGATDVFIPLSWDLISK